jgi:hypothetical protein
MHCLSENAVIRHIAAKNGMEMKSAYGETDANVTLPEPTFVDPYNELITEQLAIYDNNVRNVACAWKRILSDVYEIN